PTPALACPLAPRPPGSCFLTLVSGASSLSLKTDPSSHSRDQLQWKWQKGEALALVDFGNPRQSTGYVLCIWDGTSTLVSAARIPAAGTCRNGVACWSQSSTTFQYKDDDLTPDGMQLLKLKAGTAGSSNVQAKGKGALLPDPSYPLALPVVVQLLDSSGDCWESTFGNAFAPSRNLAGPPGLFKGKSD
ncbi:hypothetical protein KGQ64_15095, partial [bacterium]|nr:hypothetical protein [bacterium]